MGDHHLRSIRTGGRFGHSAVHDRLRLHHQEIQQPEQKANGGRLEHFESESGQRCGQ